MTNNNIKKTQVQACDIKRQYTDAYYANYPYGDKCIKDGRGNCDPDPCVSEGLFEPLPLDQFVPVEQPYIDEEGLERLLHCIPQEKSVLPKEHTRELKGTFYAAVLETGHIFNGRLMAMDADRFNTNDPQWCAVAPQTIKRNIYFPGDYLKVTNTENGKEIVCKVSDKTGERFFGKLDKKGNYDERVDLSKAGLLALLNDDLHGFNYPLKVRVERVRPKDNNRGLMTVQVIFSDNDVYRYEKKPEYGKNMTESKFWPMFERYWSMLRFKKQYDAGVEEPHDKGRIVLADRQVGKRAEVRLMITDISPENIGYYRSLADSFIKKNKLKATVEAFKEDPVAKSYVKAHKNK